MTERPLGALTRRKERAGLFLDFDGTLSEIVADPGAARPFPGVSDALAALARSFAVVAVVSGRSAAELLDWLGPDVEIWGAHGAQRSRDGKAVLSDEAAPYRDVVGRAREEATREVDRLGLRGVGVEDKQVIVALHYRNATNREEAQSSLEELAARLAERHGLVCGRGRLVFELRPPIEFSKGKVILERARAASLEAVAFVGDDRVDLPGFDALDELSREGLAAVRIAVGSDEAPDELLDRADVVVDGPSGVLELLNELLDSGDARR